MRKIIVLIFVILFSAIAVAFGQTSQQLQVKIDKVYTHYGSNKKLKATDSVLRMVKHDQWFATLSPRSQNFRILRATKYRNIAARRPKDLRFVKGWTKRAFR